jgi:hypothetical protein
MVTNKGFWSRWWIGNRICICRRGTNRVNRMKSKMCCESGYSYTVPRQYSTVQYSICVTKKTTIENCRTITHGNR